MNTLINIQNKDGQLLVSSREVAENFQKNHQHVLRDIDVLKEGVQNWTGLFSETIYTHEQNKQDYREILINRDGFTLLAMGFTGSKALEWKLKYISAFNQMEAALNSPEQIMARALQIADQSIKSLQLLSSQQSQIIGELKPKADYTDTILKNKGLVTITQIAKDYGMSGQVLNNILHELGVQYCQSDQWLLYRKYQDKGYTHSNTIEITRSDGRLDVKMQTKWTMKGRLFIYELLKSQGVLPIIEKEEVS